MRAVDERVPGDVSAAAFWLVAGAIHPDAELTLRDVGVNPTRRAVIDLLRSMGADIEERRRRRRSRRRRRRAAGRPDRALVEPPGDRARARRRRRRHRRDPGPVPGRDRRRRRRPSSAAPASFATRSPTGSPGRRRPARPGRTGRGRRRRPAHHRRRRGLAGAATDSLDDHRLAMTFAIAGLVATGETVGRSSRLCRHLLSRLLRRPRKGASMTKRVVLIGHPVAHSLSGAMQQAAFDSLGIDAHYELWDRTPIELAAAIDGAPQRRLPRCQRHDPAQGAGRPAGRPADRGGARHRARSTRSPAKASG